MGWRERLRLLQRADVEDARRVAAQLGIPHYVFNFTDDFDANVVAPYVDAYAAGETPNPCVECNRTMKFGRLLERADQLGFEEVATGHHARIVDTAHGRAIARGVDPARISRTCSTCSDGGRSTAPGCRSAR